MIIFLGWKLKKLCMILQVTVIAKASKFQTSSSWFLSTQINYKKNTA